jgi:3-oxoacyl-[acyl-carrier protein] reductase
MKTVVLTGATRGLGLAIARRLLNENYRIVGLSRKSSIEFSTLTERYGFQATHIPIDISDLEATSNVARRLIKECPSIYGLINNAARGADGVLATMHQVDIDNLMRTNLLGPITLTKYIMRAMLIKREGRIVNITSTAAATGYHAMSVYSATKAGLEGFARSLSREAGRYQITVNCVAPGYMPTDMSAALQAEKLAAVKRRSPLGIPTAEDVAGAVSFLLSPAAAAITGTVVTVDGGSSA